MSGGFVVRDARPDDFAQWLPLWAGYNAFYERKGPTEVTEAMTRLTWARFFDAYEPMHALVAEANGGELVGTVHYLFHRHTVMAGPICYLQDLFTVEAARGKGVGRALIEAVYARARSVGSTRVYWQTQETNTTARRLYDQVAQKSGFIVYRQDV
jgi:GNAT superfamily N-acetyltransferase